MKKSIFSIALFLLSIGNISAQNCDNLGIDISKTYQTTAPYYNNYTTFGMMVTVTTQGTLTYLEGLDYATSSTSQMALYSDNNGAPGNLLVKTDIKPVKNNNGAILQYTPSTPDLIVTPGKYWIVMQFRGGTSTYPYTNLNDGSFRYFEALNEDSDMLDNQLGSVIKSYGGKYTNYTTPLGMILNCGSLNTIENNRNAISIYPNPSSKTISINGLKKECTYSITNANGQMVIAGKTTPNNSINIEQLPIGVYYLLLGNDTKLKFIKK